MTALDPSATAGPLVPDGHEAEARAGLISALGAFAFWGLVPIYFKAVAHVPDGQVLAHRMLWSLVLAAILLSFGRRWRELGWALASRRNLVTFLATAMLITINWGLFIWAVRVGRVLEVSLGYYINPLVNVLLGVTLLGERLTRWQMVAITLAALGVANLTFAIGAPPWISLTLAISFGGYGLLRKTARVESLTGFAIETGFLAPLALGFLVYQDLIGAGAFGHAGAWTDILLLAAGPITALPLLMFAHGARRLRLATLGLMQYIAPSVQFLLAVWLWNEVFTMTHLATYLLIWSALALYTWESLKFRA
jgi:chloramphenicol-sensitive protein RarD